MLDSVFVMPPVFDDSYYGSDPRDPEMQIMNMGRARMVINYTTYDLSL